MSLMRWLLQAAIDRKLKPSKAGAKPAAAKGE